MTLKELEKALRGLDDIAFNVDLLRTNAKVLFKGFLTEDGHLSTMAIQKDMDVFDKALIYSNECQKHIVHYEEEFKNLKNKMLLEDDVDPWYADKLLSGYETYDRFYSKK